SVVLAADDKHVVRLGTGDLAVRPKIPEVLQPVASGTEGNLRYEIMPRADMRGVTSADVARTADALRQRGYHWSDQGVDNLGIVDGRVVVVDPGGIEPVRERAILPPAHQPDQAKTEVEVDTARAPRRAYAACHIDG
ncbi:toxin, partial [Burkholderia cenocepacia]|nr:toxin [Burkholderia cenocepacia]